MRNFKDESFIQQFLSPKVIRDFRLFCLIDDDESPAWKVGAIHNDEGYRAVRETLAAQYALSEREPNIQIVSVDVGGDRSMTLRHYRADRRPLAPMYRDVMKHLAYLWGFTVRLETANEDGTIEPTHEIKVDKRRRPDLALAAALRTLP
jgi:spore cortex formation protein SpoVR/YcgB (stage V sporulation)